MGLIVMVGVYYLATCNILPADKIVFNASNIAGGSLVMLPLVYRHNPEAIVMEITFLGFAL
ncbi:CBU_0592 family membrane protein [Ruegeria denitrificans]|uniref:CBU_0592 family membrane protein n=1 Tax=Ruegeria denitrificans TaxID=1715692 RepID=UPI00071CA902